ncbi:MAG: hypothetical protein K6B44_00150 [Lachnospiraceae bacterium]|nr:hypothetical protein [Lachnospiraceae bacterium]
MLKRIFIVTIPLFLITLAGMCALPFFTQLPEMSENAVLCIEKKEAGKSTDKNVNGGMILSWPQCDGAYDYRTEVFPAYEGPEAAYLNKNGTECKCMIPAGVPVDKAVTIRVMPRKQIKLFGFEFYRDGMRGVEVTTYLHDNTAYTLNWSIDPDNKTFTASFTGGCNDCYNLYKKNAQGELELMRSISYKRSFATGADGELELRNNPGFVQLVLTFGSGGDFPLPGEGENVTFVMDASSSADHLLVKQSVTQPVVLSRADFTDTILNLKTEDLGDNRYVLSWNETIGDGYLVQYRTDEGNWQTLAEYGPEDERIYETGHLSSYRDHSFRVAVRSDDAYVTPAVTAVHTEISETYATVWPTKELNLYASADKKDKLGSVQALKALCVLADEGDMFRVYTPEAEGYIEKNKCMINLYDYLGDLCDYDITNSYYSIYAAHEYAIPGVSGEVTEGYENVLIGNGEFLVPLLYPTAEKLVSAARAALNDGYKIKIYDSYRPYVATRSIYDLTEKILDLPVPDERFERLDLNRYMILKEAGYLNEKKDDEVDDENDQTALLPDTPETRLMQAIAEKYAATGDPVPLEYRLDPSSEYYDPTLLQFDSFRTEMLGSSFRLSAFLAQNGSAHNLGIAMDMTLVDASDGEELMMQSAMHDLSYHSIQKDNNNNANILKSYMMPAGFNFITSEWWHYQDDENKKKLSPVRCENGVSTEGYKVDDRGVRYRKADGSFVCNDTIEGRYFDAEGYMTE